MTYLEELKKWHPDWDEDRLRVHIVHKCPDFEGACPFPDISLTGCVKCWNRPVDRKEKEDLSNAQT